MNQEVIHQLLIKIKPGVPGLLRAYRLELTMLQQQAMRLLQYSD